tara:strand:+ start:703 stop:1224 length:522 start_codon:yes stop_codon:yes gene_type:complete
MKINKEIVSKIEQNYIYLIGHTSLNAKYLIDKIEEGIQNSNNNFRTNVIGHMTDFKFFNEELLKTNFIYELFDKLDSYKFLDRYRLDDSWGVKEGHGCYTKEHTHKQSYISGVIYLNDHSQKLFFPEINQEVKPKEGRFVIFSGFLKHYTMRNYESKSKYAIAFNLGYRFYDQ